MANNRLWAVCKDCNEAQFITKYYPSANGNDYVTLKENGYVEFELCHKK
jgi:hypothetical protein